MKCMENKNSIAPTVVMILVFLLAVGGIWVSMPMRFLCEMHTGSPNDSVLTVIDPAKMEVSEDELHFQWGLAEIKARIAVLGLIIFLYFFAIYCFAKYKKNSEQKH